MSQITHDINLILEQLATGHVVGFPTETVYGLAADASNHHAVETIFKIKDRPFNHPLIMHVAPDWDLTQWVEMIPSYVENLIKSFWPGPLSLVLRLKKNTYISELVFAGQNTIAIRSPNHPLALEILNKLQRPIVAPSANPFGKVSPTQAEHVMQDFPLESFFILDGGSCNTGIESTILDCTNQDNCSILRHGGISQSEIQAVCDKLKTGLTPLIKVSGSLKIHYQPKKSLFYFNPDDVRLVESILLNYTKIDLLCFSPCFDKQNISYLFSSYPKTAANAFYRQLRNADQSDNPIILIELPPETSEWIALTERIKKAGRPVKNLLIEN